MPLDLTQINRDFSIRFVDKGKSITNYKFISSRQFLEIVEDDNLSETLVERAYRITSESKTGKAVLKLRRGVKFIFVNK